MITAEMHHGLDTGGTKAKWLHYSLFFAFLSLINTSRCSEKGCTIGPL